MPERARQLYAAAVDLFLERGYREVDVDDIVVNCNLSRGTFYGSYRNKRDLLDVILARSFDDLTAAVFDDSDWSAVHDLDAFVAEFRAQLRRAFQYIADNAKLLSFVILAAPGVDAEALSTLLAGYRSISAKQSEVLAFAAQRGWMRSDVEIDVALAGQLVVSCVATAASPLLLGTGEEFDVDEAARVCGDYLLGGMNALLPAS